jgi:hypothetical protein
MAFFWRKSLQRKDTALLQRDIALRQNDIALRTVESYFLWNTMAVLDKFSAQIHKSKRSRLLKIFVSPMKFTVFPSFCPTARRLDTANHWLSRTSDQLLV